MLASAIIPKRDAHGQWLVKGGKMTIKRLILMVLTLVAIAIAGFSLFNRWKEPQFQSRLELYQTNIALQAAQWEPSKDNSANLKPAREAILGDKPLEAGIKQYQDVREAAETNLEETKNQLAKLQSQPITTPTTPKSQPEIPPVTNASREVQQKQLQQSLNQQQKIYCRIRFATRNFTSRARTVTNGSEKLGHNCLNQTSI